MRADRLLTILMILQSRKRMTAGELAREVGVSERTIYRDIVALSTAGIPVYTEKGPGGGISLVESYRTNLTGLTKGETRALFMLNIPAPLDELGLSQELKTALLKLSAALPSALQIDGNQVRQRVYIDTAWWQTPQGNTPHLQTVQEALWQDRKLLVSRRWRYDVYLERLLAPYGLVAKAGVWYLVWGFRGQIGVYRINDLMNAKVSDQSFTRPENFDLENFWKQWCAARLEIRGSYLVTLHISPQIAPHISQDFGRQVSEEIENTQANSDRWKTIRLPFDNLEHARKQILGYGNGVEVIDPLALRLSVQDYAYQIVKLYSR
jgi:predicted DNA-binding transcriptional regulator YafY